MQIFPCSISDVSMYSMAVMISAIPALSWHPQSGAIGTNYGFSYIL